MTEDKRTKLIDLYDRARVNGVAYLFAIAVLGSATVPELSDITGESDDTLGKYLIRMESRGLCMRVRDGKADRWHLAASATLLLHAADSLLTAPTGAHLLPKISGASSSSSDQSDRSDLDQISDRSESEEEVTTGENRLIEDRAFKAWLCRHYGFTGDKAQAVITTDKITPETIVAWMCQVGQMKQSGYKFKRSAESYALYCIIKGDEPNANANHMMQIEIDHYWEQYQAHIASADQPAQPDASASAAELAERQRHQAITAAYAEVDRLNKAINDTDIDDRPALIAQRRAAHQRWQELINAR